MEGRYIKFDRLWIHSRLYVVLLLQLLFVVSTGSSATVTDDNDERTLLDTFGEAAKEYLTQKVIPPTSMECNWDWRHARCEPYCRCHFSFQWGDYHLGRACRSRDPNSISNTTCDTPPDTRLAKVLQATIRQSQQLGTVVQTQALVTLQTTGARISQLQAQVCEHLPESCFSGERHWKEKLLCGYIPSCEEEPTQEDYDNTKMTGFSKGKWHWN